MSTAKITTSAGEGKSIADIEAEAYDLEARAASLRADARRKLAAEQREQQRPIAVRTMGSPHMTRREYAHRSRVSTATVARWVDEGMPTLNVGTTDRIDVDAADAWRRMRPRKATTRPPAS
jgi:hypothetical protein